MYCGLVPLPSLIPEEPFCECVVPEVSLTSRMRTNEDSVLPKLDIALPCSCHNLYLEVIFPQKIDDSCSAWDPPMGPSIEAQYDIMVHLIQALPPLVSLNPYDLR